MSISQAAAEAAEAQESEFSDSMQEAAAIWLDSREATESGYVPDEALTPEHVASPEAAQQEDAAAAPAPLRAGELATGTWVEIMVNNQWVRAQLTWASPHATLFMFTSLAGTAHSMSRRTMDRLRSQGLVKVVAERHVVDEALDQVAKAALKNSVDGKS